MACGACASKNKKQTYIWTSADGRTTVPYNTEVEAKAKVARAGGTWKAA